MCDQCPSPSCSPANHNQTESCVSPLKTASTHQPALPRRPSALRGPHRVPRGCRGPAPGRRGGGSSDTQATKGYLRVSDGEADVDEVEHGVEERDDARRDHHIHIHLRRLEVQCIEVVAPVVDYDGACCDV